MTNPSLSGRGAWSNNVAIGSQSGAFAQTVGSLSTNTTYYFTAEATNSRGRLGGAVAELHHAVLQPGFHLAAVLTYHNDNTRMGVNSNETILTPGQCQHEQFWQVILLHAWTVSSMRSR